MGEGAACIGREDFMASVGFGRDDEDTHSKGFYGDIGKRVVVRRNDHTIGPLIEGDNRILGAIKGSVFRKAKCRGISLIVEAAAIRAYD
jgi:hypothetical protein